jgi:hypothetical protein
VEGRLYDRTSHLLVIDVLFSTHWLKLYEVSYLAKIRIGMGLSVWVA